MIVLSVYPFTYFLVKVFHGEKNWEPLIVLSGLILLFSGLIYLIHQLRTVDFDQENIYITFMKETDKIPLENITKVKMIVISVNEASFYKISYKTLHGGNDSVRIIPTSNFEEFKLALKGKNNAIKVRNWSHSFDFDI